MSRQQPQTAGWTDILTDLVSVLDGAESSMIRLEQPRHRLSVIRGEALPDEPIDPWTGDALQRLETACAAAFWAALQGGDVLIAKLVTEERNRRLGDSATREEIAALDESAWDAAALFSRLIPDLVVLGESLSERRAQGDNLDRVIDRLIEDGPAALADAPAVIDALREFVADEWGPGEDPWLPFGVDLVRKVDDRRQVVAALRAAIRGAMDLEEGGVATPLVVRLNASDDAAFADIARRLAGIRGYQGIFVAQDRSFFSEGEPLLCACAFWLIEERPVLLEICHPGGLAHNKDVRLQALAFLEQIGLDQPLIQTVIDVHPLGVNPLGEDERAQLEAPPTASLDDLFGPERCLHYGATWILSTSRQSLHLRCPDCLRLSVAVVPLHRLAESDYLRYEDVIDSEERYLARERIRALILGEDEVPATMATLRGRLPTLSLEPVHYAIAPPPTPLPRARRRPVEEVLVDRRRP